MTPKERLVYAIYIAIFLLLYAVITTLMQRGICSYSGWC